MKIYVVGSNQDNKVGGGWTWSRNFRKCFADQIVETPEECDIYFITSVSMLGKLSEIPQDKKIVLRVDNILKKSCNRDIYPFEGEKVSMMKAMQILAQKADLVVYQSEWAKSLLNDYLKPKKSVVILNSTDENVFKNYNTGRREIYLYSRSSNHDNKQWHQAYYYYMDIHRINNEAELWLLGRFSPENIPNNFDFFNGENVKYFGYISDDEQMAFYLNQSKYFIYTYFNDACSNTLIEAILCGCNIICPERPTGGAIEILDKVVGKKENEDYFKLPRMKEEYKTAMEEL